MILEQIGKKRKLHINYKTMQIKEKEVRYEFYSYGASGNVLTQTLVLNDPGEVTFTMQGTSGSCIINNVYALRGAGAVFNGTADVPYELKLKTNTNEIDKTIYKISLDGITYGDATLIVVCKYYVKN